MSVEKFFDKVSATIMDALSSLQFNGSIIADTNGTYGRNKPIKNVQDPVDDQDVVTKKYLQDNGAGGVKSVNDNLPDIAGNIALTLDDVATEDNTSSVPINVPHSSVAPVWATQNSVPTRKDVYEGFATKAELEAQLAAVTGRYSITLPSAATVAGRVAAAIEGTDFPAGWVLAVGTSEYDLLVTHGQDLHVANINVFAIEANSSERLLRPFDNAYSGILAPDTDSVLVEALTDLQKDIRIIIDLIP